MRFDAGAARTGGICLVTPPYRQSELLRAGGAAHAFFGRAGGVSTGVFSTLNAGLGSSDAREAVEENRRRCRTTLNADRLLTLHQTHSADPVIVNEPWSGVGPKADGMATRLRGVALGVLAADCMPFLFIDPEAEVIAAAHAGWKGALAGILEATIKTMASLGARPERIKAAVGPCLRQANFEVGFDVYDAFTSRFRDSKEFFAAGRAPDKRQFDLVGFAFKRLRRMGLEIDDLALCTLADPGAYFSYRASRRRGDVDYGRNLSAIVLPRA
jgi:hypothetical protein